jgi:hypothetical protein
VEHEFRNVNQPTGWAILTADTADSALNNELDGFISNLEGIAVVESEPSLSVGICKPSQKGGVSRCPKAYA